MNGILTDILATVGGIVVIPVIAAGLDCALAYYTNTADDLKSGVYTPLMGVKFTINNDFKNK